MADQRASWSSRALAFIGTTLVIAIGYLFVAATLSAIDHESVFSLPIFAKTVIVGVLLSLAYGLGHYAGYNQGYEDRTKAALTR